MKLFIVYSAKIIAFTLILAGVIFLVNSIWEPLWIHEKIELVVWFYFGLSFIVGLFSQYLLKISKENSVSILLGAGLIRLLASLGFVFIIIWSGAGNILWFVVNFFVVYLLYLLFDIYTFIANLRPHSKQANNN